MEIKINLILFQMKHRKSTGNYQRIQDGNIRLKSINIIHKYKLKRKVTHQHINSIKEFLIEYKGEYFTVKTIQLF